MAAFLKAFRDSKWVSAAFYGLRPASTALVAAAGISVVPIALLHSGMTGLAALNWPAIALAAVLLVCTNWVPVVKKWHPIVFIGISALVGVLLKFEKRETLRVSLFVYISPGRADYRCYTVRRFVFYV